MPALVLALALLIVDAAVTSVRADTNLAATTQAPATPVAADDAVATHAAPATTNAPAPAATNTPAPATTNAPVAAASAESSEPEPAVATAPAADNGEPVEPAAKPDAWRLRPETPYDLIRERLSIGARQLHLALKRDQKGKPFQNSFIGSIDKLEAVQDQSPDRFFIQYAIFPWIGFGYQQDALRIRTRTTMPRAERVDDRDTDGDVVMDGDLSYLFLRLPNPTPCTPFLEFGRASYDTTFEPNEAWYAGGARQFILDPSTKASYEAGGLEFALHRYVQLDVYYRAMDMNVPGVYHYKLDGRAPEPFVFTLKHASYGVGARVLF